MQKPLHRIRVTRYVCILVILCNCYLPAFSQTIYVAPSGNDVSGSGTAGNPYKTITQGVAMAAAGNTIQLGSGTYNELVVINKSVTIDGVSASQATVTYTGTIADYSTSGTVLPTLFKVTAQNVVIRNINFVVNQNIVHSAVHTAGDASGLQVLNNTIKASLTNIIPFIGTAATALNYAKRNAIALNPSIIYGVSKYSSAPSGLSNVKISGNMITGTTAAQNGIMEANFRAGVHADNVYDLLVGGTTAEKNTIQTINQDVIVRFFLNGDVTIRNNEFNGGGVELSTTNSSSGTITVDSNYFNYLPPTVPAFALLRALNGSTNKTTIIKGNTFYNHNWYLSLGNYNTVFVDSNIFTPVIRDPGAHNDFRLITVNSKVLQSAATTKVINNATFSRNQFNGAAGANGTGIAFYNHDAPASFGIYTVGETGSENVFNTNISRFFYVDNSNGQSTSSMTGSYPEYGSGIFNTTTGLWTQNILASQNWYDIGAGSLMRPDTMIVAQRNTLNSMITDRLDDATIGLVFLYNILLAWRAPDPAPRTAGQVPGIVYQLYPNPVVNGLNVQVTTPKKQPVQLRVFNMNGHCLQMLQETSNRHVRIEMSRWPAGVYTIELVTPAGSSVRQVIKR